jgi:hypothetical protein
MDRRLPCQACGTWTCSACGWRRLRANLRYPDHRCARCGSGEGTMVPTRHGGAGGDYAWPVYYEHNPLQGPVCSSWPGGIPQPACGHASCYPIWRQAEYSW